ncbi:hypothetical protein NM208_g14805 [Fusarium decemcellulare]|uniref:Uncharacterized protein n=1 Tax=Fusarium decemcellulare TaxID=57161 RepID=A0ACC1RI93_9HYPO|nr:hypothetical protein NM208_g14805 [Fusarium decemcellulare]
MSAQQDITASRTGPTERLPTWIERAYQQSQATPENGTPGQSNDSPDVAVNTDDASHRVKYMGSSSLQCLCRFVDLCFETKGLDTIGPYFRWGMSCSEEYSLPLSLMIPNLPAMPAMEPLIHAFFERVHPLTPVLEYPSFMADVRRFTGLQQTSNQGLQGAVTSSDAAALVVVYSVLTIAMDDMDGLVADSATPFLDAAYSLVSHLISFPYLASVQALLLLAFALHGRGKEGQSWHLLGQSIRIAHSLGLHRHISSSKPKTELHSRIWWTCYAFEKMMELETGRPSAIMDFDCDQILPKPNENSPLQEEGVTNSYFTQWITLSRVSSQISEHIYRKKATTSLGFMSEIARLDQALVDWLESASDEFKPGHKIIPDTGDAGPKQLFAHFLSLQYRQAQITLLRASLAFPEKSFSAEIKKHGTNLPNSSRMLQYQNICVEAARTIITETAEFADRGLHCILLTATQPFLAAVTLALHTLKKPHKRMGRSDGELVRTATDFVADYYHQIGQHEEFIKGVLELSQRMNQVLSGERHSAEQGRRTSSMELPEANPMQSDQLSLTPFYAAEMEPIAFDPNEHFHDPFQDMPFDQFWAIMDSGFTTIEGDEYDLS